jgi:two-component system OmpR family sensor kinase
LGLRRSDGRRTVLVAESRAHRREVLWESSLGLLAPLLAVLPLAAWVLHRVLRAAFRTLEPSRLMLDGSRGDVLQALPIAGLPQELHPLVLALNGLIERVHLLLDGERSFAARTAHELRTPLAAARAQAQRLQQLAGGGDIADRAQALVRQLDRITALATRLLQLARIESGVAWRRERVDLALLARMVVDEFAEGRTGGRLHWQASSDAGGVLGDADALGIALRNLIDNALRHGGAAARVDVEIGPGRIVVRDDGPGVGEGELARLLRPFERGNAAVEGSGLGLAMVSTVARQSDARLALRSPVSGGRGFEAELSLPVA